MRAADDVGRLFLALMSRFPTPASLARHAEPGSKGLFSAAADDPAEAPLANVPKTVSRAAGGGKHESPPACAGDVLAQSSHDIDAE